MKIKRIQVQTFLLTALLLLLLIVGFLSRTTLNNFISQKMKEQVDVKTTFSAEEMINSKYNYLKNNLKYDFTLLEFGSTGCTICKQMEPVLEEIRNSGNPKVNVVFLNIMKPENLPMMKYFGISAVPMQILLDKKGKEFFRNYGFISSKDLLTKFNISIYSQFYVPKDLFKQKPDGIFQF
jgi:thioredoxin 1